MNILKKISMLMLLVVAVVFTACDKDDPEVFGKPVVNENFTVTVTGNNVTLNCNMTTATAFLWEVSTGEQFTDKQSTVYVPIAGEYTVILSVSNGGDYLASEPFTFKIEASDVALFQTGIWKALTGGPNVKKTWVLDVEKKFFHNPLDFYGDSEAGLGGDGKSWGPWGGTSLYDWGGAPEVGEISFDAISGMMTLVLDGETKTEKYQFKTYERIEDFVSPAILDGETPITLWQNMLKGKYSYMGSLSAQMGDLKFSAGHRFPMDIGRIKNDDNTINPSQFLAEDLENVVIMHASDSAMIVRVKRTYEGDGLSKCWLLYNYVVKEYTYMPEKFTYSESVKTGFTKENLVGTWKYDAVPQAWISFAKAGDKGTNYPARMFATWKTRDEIVASLLSWGASDAADKFTAADANAYVFNADGSCVLNGVSNTYTVANGVVTFGTALGETEFNLVWLNLQGTELKVIDFAKAGEENEMIDYEYTGIWLGNKNGDKSEYQAIHLVKK